MEYSRPVRSAISRILSDLIKSDEVISVTELDSFDRACKEFGIDSSDRETGFGITLQTAFETIVNASSATKRSVYDAMNSIARADNECCRAEAMLMVALKYAIEGRGVRVFSMPFRNRPILSSQILFLENPSSRAMRYRGDILANVHEQVANIVEAAGFDLVYIPEICSRLGQWDKLEKKGNIERVFSLIEPTLAKDVLSNMAKMSKNLTTRRFYEEVLCSDEGLAMPIEIHDPSWMVRLCNSTLNGEGFANFMCLRIDCGDSTERSERDAMIRKQMHDFVDDLNDLQGSYTITVNRHRKMGEDFQYGGFYKVLFDVLLGRRQSGWTLNIHSHCYARDARDGKRCQLSITENGVVTGIPLTGMDAAFYVLAICMSVHGGLDVNNQSKLSKLFTIVYRHMTMRDLDYDQLPDITKPITFRQVKHRVGKGLADVAEDHDLGLNTVDGKLVVGVDISSVMVKGLNKAPVPLLESDIYRNIVSALSNNLISKI